MWFVITAFCLLSPSNGDLFQPNNNEDHIRFYRLYYAPFEVPAPIPSTKGLVEVPSNHAENIICPDKKASCEEGDTCCLTTHDRYGCCPLPHAVCCSDKLHCCPQGTHCDVKHNRCVEGNRESALPTDNPSTHVIFKYQSSAEQIGRAEDQIKELACPENSSPCAFKDTIACCPLKNGVCCPDGLHCCPSGYRCAVDKCQPDGRNDWLSILTAIFA